jgi:Outer membrane lipoprotein carrier protein LolA-like
MGSKAQTLTRRARCRSALLVAVLGIAAWTGAATAANVTLAAVAAHVSVLAAATAPTSTDPPTSAAPTSVSNLDPLMALLAQRQHGHVTFVEEHFLAVLDRPTESTGELLYDAPDRLEKRTLKPKPETVILEHGVITAHRGHRTYVLNLSDYPQIVPLIDSIRATLAGDRVGLERTFKVTLDGSLEHWTLLLLPSDASVAKSVKQIRIEGTQDAIHTVEIQQADGDRSLLTIGPEVAQ